MLSVSRIRIGVAGWSLPKEYRDSFESGGSHLERYAKTLNAVEINSSFYRPHRRQTYIRWASSVPSDFRFSVKMPKSLSHEHRLRDCDDDVAQFVEEISGLGEKLGCVLVQLPPSLKFEESLAQGFFKTWRASYAGPMVCEPRHPTWFGDEVESLLADYQVGRVAADPPRHPTAMTPAGHRNVTYYRLHGSPKIYYSAYSLEQVQDFADRLQKHAPADTEAWCIFDNTAEGFAVANALQLRATIETATQGNLAAIPSYRGPPLDTTVP